MGTKVNRAAYEKLIKEDLEWLLSQPRTLERDHIQQILLDSPNRLYGDPDKMKDAAEKLLGILQESNALAGKIAYVGLGAGKIIAGVKSKRHIKYVPNEFEGFEVEGVYVGPFKPAPA